MSSYQKIKSVVEDINSGKELFYLGYTIKLKYVDGQITARVNKEKGIYIYQGVVTNALSLEDAYYKVCDYIDKVVSI